MKKVIPANAVLIPDNAKRVFNGAIFDVYQWQQREFDGSKKTYEMLKRPDTVTAICLVGDKIIVLYEEQPHIGPRISFPIGKAEESDGSILKAAQRETKEETGYEFAQWKLLDVVQVYSKIEWFVHVYLAYDVTHSGETSHEAGERITPVLKTLDEIQEMAEQDTGYIGKSRNILKAAKTLDDLKNLPQYQGQTVDR